MFSSGFCFTFFYFRLYDLPLCFDVTLCRLPKPHWPFFFFTQVCLDGSPAEFFFIFPNFSCFFLSPFLPESSLCFALLLSSFPYACLLFAVLTFPLTSQFSALSGSSVRHLRCARQNILFCGSVCVAFSSEALGY